MLLVSVKGGLWSAGKLQTEGKVLVSSAAAFWDVMQCSLGGGGVGGECEGCRGD